MGRMFFSYKEVVLSHEQKFLSILTGVSALAVAGLLSIIPSSVSHAAPSQAPARVNTTIHVEDRRSGYDPNSANPYPTNVNCEFEYSLSSDETSNGECYFDSLQFSVYDDAQDNELEGNGKFPCLFNDGDTISGTFRFTYDGMNYAASISTDLYPVESSSFTYFDVNVDGNNIHATVSPSSSPATSNNPVNPSTPGTPAAPSENPGTPSGDPAAKAFNEAINNTVNEIELAILGLNADGTVNETRTVEYKSSGAISPKIINVLAHAENVTLIYTFEYEGIIFQSAISSEAAAAMYSPTIPWYGPCYIATFCPPIPIGFVQ